MSSYQNLNQIRAIYYELGALKEKNTFTKLDVILNNLAIILTNFIKKLFSADLFYNCSYLGKVFISSMVFIYIRYKICSMSTLFHQQQQQLWTFYIKTSQEIHSTLIAKHDALLSYLSNIFRNNFILFLKYRSFSVPLLYIDILFFNDINFTPWVWYLPLVTESDSYVNN